MINRLIDGISRRVNSSFWSRLLFSLLGFGTDIVTIAAGLGVGQSTSFPKDAITGSLGDLALELSKGTEVPEEFIFAAAVTCFGSMASGSLKLAIGLDSDTRLFTVLLGKSATAKKSSSMARTIEFFKSVQSAYPLNVNYGVGSAEGLAKELKQHPRLLLSYDELRAFLDKSKIQASVLLPMITSLFEKNSWDNTTKMVTVRVRDARLSLLGCCTTDTYQHIWTTEAIALGMPNRLFVVDAEAKPKRAWPEPPDAAKLDAIRQRIQQQLAKLPLTLDVTADAKARWEQWYNDLPASEHAKRLDTIGFRLMPILALTTDKDSVDLQTVEHVVAMLEYELRLRVLTDPIDADSQIAKLEERIRRTLEAKGPLTKRELRQCVHADRYGLWAFEAALRNLEENDDIDSHDGKYHLLVEAKAGGVANSVASPPK